MTLCIICLHKVRFWQKRIIHQELSNELIHSECYKYYLHRCRRNPTLESQYITRK